ncbi:MAG TPA: hypothetical protein VE713_20175 [Pyrinomonadaceae bacterium]|jgi:hypothetical protein|nr:hypothetical protein [Pyrinomonadaceae bacterium]
MLDRKGRRISVIYRSRQSLKPPVTNRNLSRERARRVRQAEHATANATRRARAS